MNSNLLSPSEITAARYPDSDLRFGNLLAENYQDARLVLIGFPTDEGVSRNGGRSGARLAPDNIRKALYKLCPDARSSAGVEIINSTCDVGDIVHDQLEMMHDALGEVVAAVIQEDKIPVILGGGHETAYGHFLGYEKASRQVSIVNLDAHADVRPLQDGLGHSGSPFRQALEHPSATAIKYQVLGLQPQSVSGEHLQYLDEKGANYSFREEYSLNRLRETLAPPAPIMATFDVDVVDSSYAPGVSAPCTNGLSSQDLLEAMYLAGLSPNVHSIDVVEVNPSLDIDNRTAKLAALGIWNFIRGVSRRANS